MSIAIETPIHFTRAKAGRKKLALGPELKPKTPPPDSIPRISRLMALAIHFDGLIRKGTVRDYADLARLGGVSRARITQIMNLLNLPPWKQEEILFLPGAVNGREAVTERDLRAMAAMAAWEEYRKCGAETRIPQRRIRSGFWRTSCLDAISDVTLRMSHGSRTFRTYCCRPRPRS